MRTIHCDHTPKMKVLEDYENIGWGLNDGKMPWKIVEPGQAWRIAIFLSRIVRILERLVGSKGRPGRPEFFPGPRRHGKFIWLGARAVAGIPTRLAC